MIYSYRPRQLAFFLALLFGILNAAAIAADEAGVRATVAAELPAFNVPVRSVAVAERPILVALTDPDSKAPAPKAVVPPELLQEPPAWPAPAKFFTINQVLAKHRLADNHSASVQLASVDPTGITSDAAPAAASPVQSGEPFGLFAFRAPEGQLWTKWRKVEADISADAPTIARCRAEADQCTPATARFVAIIEQAVKEQGRARLELVNERINDAIRYTTDMAQWHEPDVWSAPLDANGKGSFDTGLGDCEDYAIAKYVALRDAGVPADDLRLMLVHDNYVHMGHAVLAARQDGRWLVLDNRWTRLIEDKKIKDFTPLFALEEDGVKMFAAPYAANAPAGRKTVESDLQLLKIGADAPDAMPGEIAGAMAVDANLPGASALDGAELTDDQTPDR